MDSYEIKLKRINNLYHLRFLLAERKKKMPKRKHRFVQTNAIMDEDITTVTLDHLLHSAILK